MIQVIYGPEYLLIWQGRIEVAVGKKTEFHGQRMLQLVVTKGHNILKVTEVTF